MLLEPSEWCGCALCCRTILYAKCLSYNDDRASSEFENTDGFTRHRKDGNTTLSIPKCSPCNLENSGNCPLDNIVQHHFMFGPLVSGSKWWNHLSLAVTILNRKSLPSKTNCEQGVRRYCPSDSKQNFPNFPLSLDSKVCLFPNVLHFFSHYMPILRPAHQFCLRS